MLSPEYLDQAGEKVAGVYRQIEADMLAYLARLMVEGGIADQRSLTALELLAQSSASKLMEIIGEREADISRAVRLEVTDAIKRCSADDLRRIKQGLGVDLEAATTRQAALTIGGVARILERDNIDMAEGARRAFLDASTWAVMQVNSGAMTTERALHMAVRRLERDGVSVVQYRNAATGAQTVANKVDVAVRRHIRTQILQDGMAMTEGIMDQADVQLVEVSSHGGSRPSHAKWEGRVYSRHGDQVIDGVLYRDFKTACNWGDVADGIGGANCRHSYSAWFPGMKRLYEPDPPHPSGLDNAEVYELTQRQRAGEREIRATKRELAGAQMLYEKSKSEKDLGEVLQLKLRLRDQQARMRQLVGDNPKVLQRSPRREWAGDMPKVTLTVSAQTKKRALDAANLKDECAKKRRPIFDDGTLGAVAGAAYRKIDKTKGYPVVCHGAPDFVEVLGKKTDHKLLADVIRQRDDYEEGSPVLLLSCSTGKDPKRGPCFAQRLADELGAPVTAPNGILQVFSNGRLEVGNNPGDNTGEFITFEPRRGKR